MRGKYVRRPELLRFEIESLKPSRSQRLDKELMCDWLIGPEKFVWQIVARACRIPTRSSRLKEDFYGIADVCFRRELGIVGHFRRMVGEVEVHVCAYTGALNQLARPGADSLLQAEKKIGKLPSPSKAQILCTPDTSKTSTQ